MFSILKKIIFIFLMHCQMWSHRRGSSHRCQGISNLYFIGLGCKLAPKEFFKPGSCRNTFHEDNDISGRDASLDPLLQLLENNLSSVFSPDMTNRLELSMCIRPNSYSCLIEGISHKALIATIYSYFKSSPAFYSHSNYFLSGKK